MKKTNQPKVEIILSCWHLLQICIDGLLLLLLIWFTSLLPTMLFVWFSTRLCHNNFCILVRCKFVFNSEPFRCRISLKQVSCQGWNSRSLTGSFWKQIQYTCFTDIIWYGYGYHLISIGYHLIWSFKNIFSTPVLWISSLSILIDCIISV